MFCPVVYTSVRPSVPCCLVSHSKQETWCFWVNRSSHRLCSVTQQQPCWLFTVVRHCVCAQVWKCLTTVGVRLMDRKCKKSVETEMFSTCVTVAQRLVSLWFLFPVLCCLVCVVTVADYISRAESQSRQMTTKDHKKSKDVVSATANLYKLLMSPLKLYYWTFLI